MGARNPWQNLKDEALKIRTPTQVLQEQAGFLQDATDGIIRGRVSAEETNSRSRVTLKAYVPTLNNYSVDLLQVYHPVVQYPPTISSPWVDRRPITCEGHAELEAAVVDYLEAPELQKVVIGLFAQTAAPADASLE